MGPSLPTKIIPACLILILPQVTAENNPPGIFFFCLIWGFGIFFSTSEFFLKARTSSTPQRWEHEKQPEPTGIPNLAGAAPSEEQGCGEGRMLSPGLAPSGHISSGSPTWGCLIPDVGRVPHFRENSREFWLWKAWRKSLRAAKVYLEVLNLCLHQPLKCISQNSSGRTSLLLFPLFSPFHVVGKETQSPLLILQRGKSKHTNINKAVNHPLRPCHQVPTKPPWLKVSAGGSGPPGPQSPP